MRSTRCVALMTRSSRQVIRILRNHWLPGSAVRRVFQTHRNVNSGRSIGQFDRFLDGGSNENVFVTTFAKRTAEVEGISEEVRKELVSEAEQVVRDDVLPAFETPSRYP